MWISRPPHPRRSNDGSQGHFNNIWNKSEITMLMSFPGSTLKPLVLAVARHPRALICALAVGMSSAHAAESTDSSGSDAAPANEVAVPAAAAAPATTQLKRVEVTGSAIRRVDAETAVPITVLRADDLRKQGVSTTAEIISRITASNSLDNASGSVGSATGGASFADLRGIGANKTLILLNGRRLANNSMSGTHSQGGAVDLNTIPFAAIDRVEILRDGASALYGTDAIGGVINFITKKSLTDGSLSLGGEMPDASGGGGSKDMSGSWGFGDLEEDRFNVMGVFNYAKQQNLDANDRTFAKSYQPNRGLDATSGTAFPSNYTQGDSPSTNPLGAACAGANLHPNSAGQANCRYDTRNSIDLIPQTEKTSFFGKATGKIAEDHNVSLEYFWARNNNATTVAPAPYTGIQVNPDSPYFPGNGITPLPENFTLDPNQPVDTSWRETAAGDRSSKDANTAQRLLLNFTGTAVGWDYDVGASYNQSKVTNAATGGYASDRALGAGIASGLLNPFGPQSAAGQQYINDNLYHGIYSTAVGRVTALDGRVSREIGDWFGGGQSGLAIGGEYRKEKFHQTIEDFAGDLQSLGVDPSATVAGDRSIRAEYAELTVPVLDNLELSAAVRHDKFSDFGSTTNPKYSFRYQPIKELVVRGSYSEGFRAPSLYELNNPNYTTFTTGSYNDPTLCTGGTAQPGGNAARDCGLQFNNRTGGNHDLSPEQARNKTIGFVFQPIRDLSVGLDFWWIKISDQIAEFPEASIFANPDLYADRIVRGADGSIDHINTGLANLGKVKTNGVDVTLDYRFPNTPIGQFGLNLQGTYTDRYDYQEAIDGVYIDKVGDLQSSLGVAARWKHNLVGTWNLGAYRASLTNRFTTGYNDTSYDDGSTRRVASYALWDMSAGYTFDKTLDLDAGVKNMFDRNPPFSIQTDNFQTGYDPRYAEAMGRTLFARATYHF
jgi:iron complex outermembrane receptor protein